MPQLPGTKVSPKPQLHGNVNSKISKRILQILRFLISPFKEKKYCISTEIKMCSNVST